MVGWWWWRPNHVKTRFFWNKTVPYVKNPWVVDWIRETANEVIGAGFINYQANLPELSVEDGGLLPGQVYVAVAFGNAYLTHFSLATLTSGEVAPTTAVPCHRKSWGPSWEFNHFFPRLLGWRKSRLLAYQEAVFKFLISRGTSIQNLVEVAWWWRWWWWW